MPYLQIDVPRSYPLAVKRDLATRMAETYSTVMEMDIERVSVAIRELGDSGLWRFPKGKEPYQAAVLMLDIRRGRPPAQRAALAKALIELCMEALELQLDGINVEFTQHAGDEMYHPILGGLSKDWSADEKSQ